MYLKLPIHIALITGIVTLSLGCTKPFDVTDSDNVLEPWIGIGETTILVDSAHQWEARPDFILDEYEFRYCHSQSSSRLLNNLIEHDFRYRQFREGTLDYPTLKKHDILFFNIPTLRPGGRSKPDRKFEKLTSYEIDSIVRFVEEGGGLFVVAEHNNAYDHASILNPLLENFGIEVPPAYALDKSLSKYTIAKSSILIRIHEYKEHPVTRGLRETSWLGGGPLVSDSGIAFLSKNGHADLGNYITGKPSKHSNRKIDPGEKTGPNIPLFAAVEHGKGRVVVIGDHNMIGIQWLGIADNYRFAMNTFAWLSKRESESPHIADIPPKGLKLGFDLTHTQWNPGIRDRRGFHPAFINFSRHPNLFAMGILDLNEPADVLLLADPSIRYNNEDLQKIEKRLSSGQRVIILSDFSEPQIGTVQLIQEFIGDVTFHTSSGEKKLSDLELNERDQLRRIKGKALPVHSNDLEIEGLEIASIIPSRYSGKGKYVIPRDLDKGTPYLLDITVDEGVPFIDADGPDGQKITIARRFSTRGGEIVLFVQSKIWGNETFGSMRDEPAHDAAYGSHDLLLAFSNWLASQPPIVSERNSEQNIDENTDTKTNLPDGN